MKESRPSTCAIFAAMLLAIGPSAVVAQVAAAPATAPIPMATLDLEFDKKKTPEINRIRALITELGRVEAAQLNRRNKAAVTDTRNKLEAPRNAMADMAIDYIAQIEIAEAVGRLDFSQSLAEQYRKHFPDTYWRIDWRTKTGGDASAYATLGGLHRLGIVAERSEVKACDFYRRAAQKGHVASLYRASNCGDAKSEAAVRMRDLAADGGHPMAQELRGRQCLQEKQGAQCALPWLTRAAAQGRASALSLLGFIYSTGELVPRDDSRAFAYVMDAAKLGDLAAQNNVGQLYETGRGVPANGDEAFAWYQRAAEAGLGSAQVNLARSYIEGRGTAPDRAAAVFWLEHAKKQGVAEAGKLLDWLAAH